MGTRSVASAPETRPGLVFDTGALLAVEEGRLTDVVRQAVACGLPIRVSGGVLAQSWRGGPRSARLSALLKKDVLVVVALDAMEARRVGEFVARAPSNAGRADVVDAHVALMTRETSSLVYTSDLGDLVRYGVPRALVRRV